jgi:hypothetical protein
LGACEFGTDYLSHLQNRVDEAPPIAEAKGATIIGIRFLKPQRLEGIQE